jgi:hypothetical protein
MPGTSSRQRERKKKKRFMRVLLEKVKKCKDCGRIVRIMP